MIPLTAASLILLLTALCIWRHVSHRSTNVPVVPGLPLFGNLIALGRGGVAFISQCRDKVRSKVALAALARSQLMTDEDCRWSGQAGRSALHPDRPSWVGRDCICCLRASKFGNPVCIAFSAMHQGLYVRVVMPATQQHIWFILCL